MSTLLERIAKCSREDDPSQHDKPRPPKWTPEWRKRLTAKDMTRSPA